ncbi:hypothetical protein OIE67_33095 [Nonomuraea fuscirosea]|jgi:hypothetical protein|uniref:hypothetical protein n=1 Tax=Nonomuraea fuscirosea TaxID=1291556 RepID=UPI002DD8E95D|nr:hypothetical protein [Nonomuraea fuscirosea]WSA58624.1 hypothetical protein OIE67_33095 [Nonomuraea fuscirosea]
MRLRSGFLVLTLAGATISVTSPAAYADHYTTYRNASSVGGTLYLHAASGPRKGARTSMSGSIFRVYANTYNGADGGLHATSNSVSSIVVLSHPRYNYGRSGCKWTLAGSNSRVNLKCESRIAS